MNKGDHLVDLDRNMIPATLRQMLEKRVKEAGLDPIRWHDFRWTFGSDIIAATRLVAFQKGFGHSSTAIRVRYNRLWKQQVEEAMAHKDFLYDFEVRQYQFTHRRR